MKNLFYLVLFISSLGFSQTGYIEIEVRDSIKLKPISLEYNIQIDDSKFIVYNNEKEVNQYSTKIKVTEKCNELKSFLKAKNYKIHPLSNNKYQIHNYLGFWKNGYVVTLEKPEGLQKLTSELKSIDYISGSIGEIEYEENEIVEKRLLSKIIEKGKTKAKIIADLSGLKLGKLIEFKEGKELDELNLNFLDITVNRISKQQELIMSKNGLFGQKWKTVTLKFIAK